MGWQEGVGVGSRGSGRMEGHRRGGEGEAAGASAPPPPLPPIPYEEKSCEKRPATRGSVLERAAAASSISLTRERLVELPHSAQSSIWVGLSPPPLSTMRSRPRARSISMTSWGVQPLLRASCSEWSGREESRRKGGRQGGEAAGSSRGRKGLSGGREERGQEGSERRQGAAEAAGE